MASRVAVVFTVVLSFFVLSSSQAQARVQLQKPENLATEWNPSNPSKDLPDSDAKSTISILLPSDAIRSYSEEIPDDRVVESEPKDLPESHTTNVIRSMRPYTLSYDDSFHPITHHLHEMPFQHRQPFRFPIRCRHRHHHRFGKPMGLGMGPRFTYGREISYGNDMIMSEESKVFPLPRFHQGEMRQFGRMRPVEDNNGFHEEDKMQRQHHHHEEENEQREEKEDREEGAGFVMIPRRPGGDNNGFREEDEMKPHHHHHHEEEDEMKPHRHHEEEDEMKPHHHHHHRHHEEENEHEERGDREEGGGFMLLKNFRKFLNDLKP